MDRDVALTLNTKLGAINTALQNIVTGIVNSAENNRSIPASDQRSLPESAMEEPETPEEPEAPAEKPETRTKK